MQDYLDLIPETPEDFDANNAEHIKAILSAQSYILS